MTQKFQVNYIAILQEHNLHFLTVLLSVESSFCGGGRGVGKWLNGFPILLLYTHKDENFLSAFKVFRVQKYFLFFLIRDKMQKRQQQRMEIYWTHSKKTFCGDKVVVYLITKTECENFSTVHFMSFIHICLNFTYSNI